MMQGSPRPLISLVWSLLSSLNINSRRQGHQGWCLVRMRYMSSCWDIRHFVRVKGTGRDKRGPGRELSMSWPLQTSIDSPHSSILCLRLCQKNWMCVSLCMILRKYQLWILTENDLHFIAQCVNADTLAEIPWNENETCDILIGRLSVARLSHMLLQLSENA